MNKTGAGGFKKGISGNPQGLLPIGDAMKMARKLTKSVFEQIAHKYMFMTYQQIVNLMEDSKDKLPIIDFAVMSILLHAVKEGDQKRIDWILDRTIGMAVRKHAVIIDDERPEAKIPVPMTPEEKLTMLELYKKKVESEIINEARQPEVINED